MKFLKSNIRFKRESLSIFYLIFLLISISCAYQQKTNSRQKSLLIKKEERTIKNDLEANNAFLNCDIDYFEKLNDSDFLYLLRGDVVKESWQKFFDQNIFNDKLAKDIPGNCFETLKVLGKNNLKSSNVFILHDLLVRNDMERLELVIASGSISSLVLNGVESQIKKITYRMKKDLNQEIHLFDFTFSKDSALKFLALINKYRINLKLNETLDQAVELETYKIGSYYPLCGYSGDVEVVYDKNTGTITNKTIPACSKLSTEPMIKVVGFDEEWIEIMYVYDLELGYDDVIEGSTTRPLFKEDDQNMIQMRTNNEGSILSSSQLPHYYVSRKLTTTPYVVTDGKIQIALVQQNVSKIFVGPSRMLIENKNTSCDNRDLVPVIVSSPVDASFDKNSNMDYDYPVGFKKENTKYIKNYYGSTNEEFQCGT